MNPSPAPRRRTPWLAILAVALVLLPAFSFLTSPSVAQEVEELGINSTRYIVVDAETGEVYAQRDANERVAIGSLTKIFTAIEAMDVAPLDTMITTDESDLRDPTNNSIMGFEAGEVLSLEELLYGLMLPSGNDAAHAIARSLGFREGDTDPQQSVDRFVGWMNQRTFDMGLTDTSLITPDGWGVPGHFTTAHDLAAFTRYAMGHPFFVTLISTQEYVTAEGNPIYNNNRLLGMYDDLVGGKTGYDWDAGWCLVEVAERDGMQMISVTLDGVRENMDWYDDNQVLLEYGFEQRGALIDAPTTWDGSLALFANPALAMIDRSTTATAAIGGQPVAETTGDTTDRVAGTAADGTNGDTTTTDAAITDPIADQQVVPEADVVAGSSSDDALTRVAQVALVSGLIGLVALVAFAIYRRTGGSLRPALARAHTTRTVSTPRSDSAALRRSGRNQVSTGTERPAASSQSAPTASRSRGRAGTTERRDPAPTSSAADRACEISPPRARGSAHGSSAAGRVRQTGRHQQARERR